MTRTWTPEQLAIFEATKSTSNNLLIEALAGAAKTTTLTELARNLSGTTMSLAFNKKIAVEMEKKMPQGVTCSTLNSLGHKVWGQAIGKRLSLNASKLHHLTIEAIESQPKPQQGELYDDLATLSNYISGSKNHGHVPDSVAKQLGSRCVPLMNDDEFFDMLPEEPTSAQIDVMLQVLSESFERALEGSIDFADQLLLPTVMKCSFPIFSNVLVDEAQDLSELNHVMLAKLAKRRIIAVGDSLQAIYAFRGAHADGMPLLRDRFNMQTLHLSTTFRCPETICAHVRWHAPRIESWSGNPNSPGDVKNMIAWNMDDIPDGSAVLCRNNAPLFRLALRMLKAGRRPNLWGRDVAASLVKILSGLGAVNMNKLDSIKALRRYQAEKESKLRKESAKESLAERIECLLVFIEDAESLGGAIALAKSVFAHEGKVDLATGHKAKGAEWPNVFILDRQLLRDDGQDPNLAYVLATRTQRTLTYITTEGYIQ
jgi:superfamily I DNA/RNA helicase